MENMCSTSMEHLHLKDYHERIVDASTSNIPESRNTVGCNNGTELSIPIDWSQGAHAIYEISGLLLLFYRSGYYGCQNLG